MYYDRVKAYFYRDSGTTQIMLGICMLSMPGLYRFAFDLCSPTPTVVELLHLLLNASLTLFGNYDKAASVYKRG